MSDIIPSIQKSNKVSLWILKKKFYYGIGMVVKKTPHNWKFQIEIVYILPNMVPTE